MAEVGEGNVGELHVWYQVSVPRVRSRFRRSSDGGENMADYKVRLAMLQML